MKIIRWLLSHTFLILLVVGVIYGYIYWGNLLGKETPVGKTVAYLSGEFVEVKDFVDAIKAKQARLNTERSSEDSLPVSAKLSSSTAANDISQVKEVIVIESSPDEIIIAEKSLVLVTEEPVEQANPVHQQSLQPEPEREPEQQEPEQHLLVQKKAEQQDPSEQQESQQQQSEQVNQTGQSHTAGSAVESAKGSGAPEHSEQPLTGGAVSNKGVFVSHEEAKQLNGIDTQGKKLDKSQHFDRVRADWMTARKSFHQRNYALSEQSYLKVIENTDDNVDAYGELGNVYFNQGKNKQAASAYYEAAAILVRKGQAARAKNLMDLLRHLDSSKAIDLQKLIESKQS